MARRSRDQAGWRGPAYGLAALAVVAPQLLGGATEEMALAIHVLAFTACAWVTWRARLSHGPGGVAPVITLGAALVTVWTLVQALPLPCSWVAWAQPDRHALMGELKQLGAIQAERCGISAAPGATWAAFAMAASLTAITLAACVVAHAGGRRILVGGIAASAIAMALVALAHWVFGASAVFGVYTPVFVKPRLLLAPLMNENHLAGLLALGLPPCVALAVAAERLDRRIAWSVAAFLILTCGLLTGSRAGAAVLFAGPGLYVAAQVLRHRRRNQARRLAGLVLGAVGGCAAALFVGYDLLAGEFASHPESFSKLALIGQLSPLALAHPWVGIGRGALGDVSQTVLLTNARAMYVESFPSQWLIEWGVPATLLLAAAIAITGSRLRWSHLRGPEVGLACGVGALGAQNLLDFSLELAGVATTAAIAVGCLASRERAFSGLRLASLSAASSVATAIALVAVLIGAPWLTSWGRDALRLELESALQRKATDIAEPLRRAFGGYPLEPVFIVLGASAAVAGAQPNAAHWLNLAMRVAPGWAGPHLLASNLLERRGAVKQAAIELSLAAEHDAWAAIRMTCDFLKRHPSTDLLFAAAEADPARRERTLEYLMACLPADVLNKQREALAQRILEEFPRSAEAHRRYVEWAPNPGLAEERARKMLRVLPGDPRAIGTLGRALMNRGAFADALALIDGSAADHRSHRELLQIEFEAATRLRLSKRAAQALEQLLASYGTSASERSAIHRLARSQLAAVGDFVAALAHAQATFDLTGEPADLEEVHAAAVRAGMVAVALRTASELCQFRYRAEVYCARSSTGPHR